MLAVRILLCLLTASATLNSLHAARINEIPEKSGSDGGFAGECSLLSSLISCVYVLVLDKMMFPCFLDVCMSPDMTDRGGVFVHSALAFLVKAVPCK